MTASMRLHCDISTLASSLCRFTAISSASDLAEVCPFTLCLQSIEIRLQPRCNRWLLSQMSQRVYFYLLVLQSLDHVAHHVTCLVSVSILAGFSLSFQPMKFVIHHSACSTHCAVQVHRFVWHRRRRLQYLNVLLPRLQSLPNKCQISIRPLTIGPLYWRRRAVEHIELINPHAHDTFSFSANRLRNSATWDSQGRQDGDKRRCLDLSAQHTSFVAPTRCLGVTALFGARCHFL